MNAIQSVAKMIFFCIVFVSACREHSSKNSGNVDDAVLVQPSKGGTVRSRKTGASVVIPANSLFSAERVSVAEIDVVSHGNNRNEVIAGVHLEPDGLKFRRPVLVRIPLPRKFPARSLFPIHHQTKKKEDKWAEATSIDGKVLAGVVSADGNTLLISTDHFSNYALLKETIEHIQRNLFGAEVLAATFRDQSGTYTLYIPCDFQHGAIRRTLNTKKKRIAAFRQVFKDAALQMDPTGEGAYSKIVSEVEALSLAPRQVISGIVSDDKQIALKAVLKVLGRVAKTGAEIGKVVKHLEEWLGKLDAALGKLDVALSGAELAANIHEDVFKILLICSIESWLVDKRLEAMRLDLKANDAPAVMRAALALAKLEILSERDSKWKTAIGVLKQNVAKRYVISGAKFITAIYKVKKTALMSKALLTQSSRLLGVSGLALAVADVYLSMRKSLDDVAYTTATATVLASLFHRRQFNQAASSADASDLDHVTSVMTKSYLAYSYFERMASSYGGGIAAKHLRWGVSKVLSLAGWNGWTKERLDDLEKSRDDMLSRYLATTKSVKLDAMDELKLDGGGPFSWFSKVGNRWTYEIRQTSVTGSQRTVFRVSHKVMKVTDEEKFTSIWVRAVGTKKEDWQLESGDWERIPGKEPVWKKPRLVMKGYKTADPPKWIYYAVQGNSIKFLVNADGRPSETGTPGPTYLSNPFEDTPSLKWRSWNTEERKGQKATTVKTPAGHFRATCLEFIGKEGNTDPLYDNFRIEKCFAKGVGLVQKSVIVDYVEIDEKLVETNLQGEVAEREEGKTRNECCCLFDEGDNKFRRWVKAEECIAPRRHTAVCINESKANCHQ